MRWSIRNQILVPLIAIQAVATTAIAVTTAALAARRSESEIVDRLNGVIDALGHASFPYTSSVLTRMRGLSGAHFVAFDPERRLRDTSFPTPVALPDSLRDAPESSRLKALGDSPTVAVEGTRYFAATVRRPDDARGESLLVLYPETSWREARREAAMPPLLLGAGSLGLMALITGWIAHRIGARLYRIRGQVALIAGGDFRPLGMGREDDEIADLTRSINRMCDQLRELDRNARVSERTRLLAQLAAGLAHQLRNSMTGARMSVQLHAKRCPASATDESLTVALRQLSMIEEQVKGLLSLGRVERREPAAFDVGALLADVALLVDPSCRHTGVTFHHGLLDGPIGLTADAPGVRAAVLNLTLNAIEAAGPRGEVWLDARTDETGAVVFEVRDTGQGPSPEVAESLFDPFVTGKPEGVGLGLALALQVAKEHAGRLSWERVNGQTRFRLTVPRAVERT